MAASKYQKAIYKAFQLTNKDINISAVAGGGKTTTLLELLKFVPKGKMTLFLAFNKNIVEELKNRNENDEVVIMTIHSCGWRAIMRRYGSSAKLNQNKAMIKTQAVLNKYKIQTKEQGRYLYNVPQLIDLMRCNMAKNELESIRELAMHYDIDIDDVEIPIVQEVFKAMNNDRKNFDFMDMIYVPVTDNTVFLKKFDYVFCDESQDFSACQHAFIKQSINRKGRLITVGDSNQAIYGFAGADADSYDKLAMINGKAIRLPLSVCYRCAKSIVLEAQKYVPSISYAPNAIEGRVSVGSLTDMKEGDWILCRNLKPLVQTYFWLIKNEIKCKIRGKEIAENLVALVKKLSPKTLDQLTEGLQQEYNRLYEKLIQRGVKKPLLHPSIEAFMQKQEVLNFMQQKVSSVDGLIRLLEDIFSNDTNGVLLSTIHKAKGLENDRILFICPELIPSRFATQDWQIVQEWNLMYVGITRAKKELIYVPQATFENDLCTNIILNKNDAC